MFLNKSLCRYYNEGHHGKFPMDDEGETIKNVIFRTQRISDAAMKFESSIITVYCLNRMK